MTIKTVMGPNIGPYEYDDTDIYEESVDYTSNPFTGEKLCAIRSDGTAWVYEMICDKTPVNSNDVVRLSDIGGMGAEFDGDIIEIDLVPTTYTRTVSSGITTSVDELSSHLNGIDLELADIYDDISDLEDWQLLGATNTFVDAIGRTITITNGLITNIA